MASAYRHAVHRIRRFRGPVSEFIRSPVYGAVKLVTLMNMWETIAPRLSASAFISYDAAIDDPSSALAACARFAGLPVDEDLMDLSIDAASIENMRAAGLSPAYAGTPLAPVDARNSASFKVGAGGQRGAAESLSEDDRAYIDTLSEHLLINPDAPHLSGCWRRPMTSCAT
jgi:hypothetical protein